MNPFPCKSSHLLPARIGIVFPELLGDNNRIEIEFCFRAIAILRERI